MAKLKKHFEKYFPVYLFILSFLVRLIYTFLVRGEQSIWQGDEGRFFRLARGLAAGQGYDSYGRMPVTSFLAALFIKLFNTVAPEHIHIFSSFLGSWLPILVFWAALYFTKDKLVAILSGLYAAVYPFFIHEASFLDTENMFIPLMIWFFIVLGKTLNNPRKIGNYFLLGMIFTASCLTRPTPLALPLFLFFYLWRWKKWPLSEIIKKFGITLLTFLVLIAPWSRFVSKGEGHFVLLNTPYDSLIGGTNKVTMFDPVMSGSWVNLERDYPWAIAEFTEIPGSTTFESGNIEYLYVWRVLKKYWYRTPYLAFNKIKKFWSFSPKHPSHRNLRDDLVGFFSYGLLMPFFILALLLENPKIKLLQELTILWASYFTFMAILTAGEVRFRLPVDPLIIILAVFYLKNVTWPLIVKSLNKS